MSYPDFFPEGCPPETAEFIDMYLFRYTVNDPPLEADFLSAFQMGKFKRSIKVQKYGLSMNSCIKDARNSIGLVPALWDYKYIAGGYASIEDGPIEYTPSEKISKHLTWYLYKNVNPYKKFCVLEKIV